MDVIHPGKAGVSKAELLGELSLADTSLAKTHKAEAGMVVLFGFSTQFGTLTLTVNSCRLQCL